MVAPGARKPKGKLDAAAQTALQARHEALALVEERFRDFDVVWAKVHGFPWWPGVLFHSWDVVRRAGIRTDPKLVASLVVPPPEKILVLDAATGEETSAYRIRRHCLVMFLDKFNFSVVEIDPRNVASFTAHYQLYQHAVMGRKKGPKTDFRRAVMKATSLLHLGEEYAVEDLVMLEEPTPAEKKRRLEMSVEEEETEEVEQDDVASLEDAWDDQEADKDAEFLPVGAHDDKASENATVVFPNNRRKAQVASRRRSQKAKTNTAADSKKLRTATVIKKSIASTKRQSAKQSHVERPYAVAEITAGVELVTPVKSQQKAPAKESKTRARKSSRKDGHSVDHIAVVSPSPSPIDLTNTPDSEQKKYRAVSKDDFSEIGSTKPSKTRKKKMNGKITATESKKKRNESVKALVSEVDGDCDHNANLDADVSKTAEQDTRVLTPLSSIWTTAVSGHQRGEAHTQLAHKQDFLWDDAVFTDDISIAEKEKATLEREQAELAVTKSAPGRERALSKRQPRSVQQSQIRQNLMTGNLDPHTMVQCASYRPKDFVEDPNSRSRGGPNLDSPFRVLMHPDAVFVADLHAHLATCEIIGFLGGKWDESTKTLYIQAAFPCRSLEIDGDDGSTDVEMDPGSEIELRGIIENAHLEVVGWYHSHPAFAPDPSVRDIENQTSYQQLFQRPSLSKSDDKGKMPSEPFVGLIVGTYDTRRSTPVSLFRYFHVRGEKVSGGACREIHMPYEFIPERRHFRSVLKDEERQRIQSLPVYPSVLQHFALRSLFIKPEQPQSVAVAKATLTRRSSPTRVKAQDLVRKRKQSTEAGNNPVKKAKAKSRRTSRSSSAAPNHVDLTGVSDVKQSQVLQFPQTDPTKAGQINPSIDVTRDVNSTLEGEFSPANVTKDAEMSSLYEGAAAEKSASATDVVQRTDTGFDTSDNKGVGSMVFEDRTTCVNGTSAATKLEKADMQCNMLRKSSNECKSTPPYTENCDQGEHEVANRPQSEHVIEPDLVEVVADAAASVTSSDSKHNISTKKDHSHRAETCRERKYITGAVDMKGEIQALRNNTNSAAKVMNGDLVEVKANGATSGDSVQSSLLSSYVKRGVSPATSVSSSGSSGRKRNRKPRKPMKNSNRSASPNRDGPSPRRSPNASNGFYDAFQASGPRIPCDPHDDFFQQSSRVEGPKQEALLVEDMKYIVVEEKDVEIAVCNQNNGNFSSKTTFDKEIQNAKADIQVVVKRELLANSSQNYKHDPTGETTYTHPHQDKKVKKEPVTDTNLNSRSATDEEQLQSTNPFVDEEVRSIVTCLVERVIAECVTKASTSNLIQHGADVNGVGERVLAMATPADKRKSKLSQKHQDGLISASDGSMIVDGSLQDVTMVARLSQVPPLSTLSFDIAPRLPNGSAINAPVKGAVKIQTELNDFRLISVQEAGAAKNEFTENKPKPFTTTDNFIADRSGVPGLFGSNCECEDIQTSLEKMRYYLAKLKVARAVNVKPHVAASGPGVEATTPTSQKEPALGQDGLNRTRGDEQAYLAALRTKYGPGVSGCTEQVITLVDYYRSFERRTDLSEIWKSRINKLEKIEGSLTEYVQFLNLPVTLRHDFVKDLIGYLRVSWRVDDQRN